MDSLFDAMMSAPPEDQLMQRTKQQFPLLNSMDIAYKNSPGAGKGDMLEFWPKDELGDASRPRPKNFPLGKFGVEVYDPTTRPMDVMGDIASHQLRYTDPVVKRTYDEFAQSLTSSQKQRLQNQYQFARQDKNNPETRPFAEWREKSGLPAYFRGYAFQQWDKPEQLYTPQQMQSFDSMMGYLKGKP